MLNKRYPNIKFNLSLVPKGWVISEGILFYASMEAFRTKELEDISLLLGVVMLLIGCINVYIYHIEKNQLSGGNWVLAEGLSTALLSSFLLFNPKIKPELIPFFFGVWESFMGVLKIIDSLELRKKKINGWIYLFVISIIEIVSGIISLLKPVEEFIGMNIVVAMILLVQGIGYVVKILMYPRLTMLRNNK